MTELTASAPAAPAPAGPGFVIPEKGPEGQPLTAREQYQHMLKNPAWARDALENGTQARQQFDDLNRRMAGDVDAAQGSPVLAMEPAKDASAYRLGFDAASSPEVQRFDVDARGWLHAMGAPEQFGSSLAQQVADVGRRCKGADQAARDLFAQQSRRSLERVYGAETDKQIAKVDAFLDAIEPKAPGLAEFLDENSFVLTDAMVIQYLIQLADAAEFRKPK